MGNRSIAIAAAGLVLAAACSAPGAGGTAEPSATTGPPAASPSADPSASSSPIPGAGRTLTPADDGTTVTLAVGQTAELVVDDPNAPDPTVEGDAVVLVAIVNIAPSGQREWEIQAVRPGESVIRGMADAAYEIRLVVDP